MPAALPIAAIAAGGLAVGSSIYQGQQAAKQTKRALRSQEQAQDKALAQARGEERRSAIEQRRLNRRSPDIGTLLAGERDRSRRGPASTLLTGSGGVSRDRLRLGKTTLLGGV